MSEAHARPEAGVVRRAVRHAGTAPVQLRVLGCAVVASGLLSVVSALLDMPRVETIAADNPLTPSITHAAAGAVGILGLALVLVGRGVLQRRLFASRVAVLLLAGVTAAHVVSFDLDGAVFTALLGALLVHRRDLFQAVPAPARLRQVGWWFASLTVAAFGYGVIGLRLHSADLQPGFTLSRALQEVGSRLVGLDGPLTIGGRFGGWFPESLTAIGGLAMLTLLAVALAPTPWRAGVSARERAQVTELVADTDNDTLAPFARRRDKCYVFSPDHRAVIAYRYVRGVGLAAGDPVGSRESRKAAIEEFVDLCHRLGWRPAFYGARLADAPLYAACGLRTFYLGDEAVIDTARYSLDGRRMRPVRQAVNRTRNFGVTTRIHLERDLDPQLRHALRRIASVGRAGAPERGFSMTLGDLLDGRFGECVVVVAYDITGEPVAFQRYVPCRDGRALSLDIPRRLPTAPNGVNERMIHDVVTWGRVRGVEEVSLNFAAFRHLLDDSQELESLQALEAWLVRRLEGRFGVQIDTLRRFNAKFQPRWVPRMLAYRSAAELPVVGVAAFSAEGFLPFDKGRVTEA